MNIILISIFFTGKHIKKSKSLQDVEFTSKPVPDLVPEDDSIQEEFCGTNQEEKENSGNVQSSYISDKMISEFHVKSREHSKSSVSLHQFLNFGKSSKDKKVLKKNVSCEENHHEIEMFQHRILDKDALDIDDLPYSNVRDSILVEPTTNDGFGKENRLPNRTVAASENIYAEIFQEPVEKLEPTSSTEAIDDDYEFQDAIDIVEDVSDGNDSVFEVSNRNEENVGAFGDNIYNTLK